MVGTSRQTNKDETIVDVNGYVHDGWLKRMVEEDGYVHDKWLRGWLCA
jgi:hypothetical protein